jgi:hypothetical protein
MSLTPEFGEEELLGRDEAGVQRRPPPSWPDAKETGEREVEESKLEGVERRRLDPDDNELHAAGQVCERCGQVITASEDVRLLPDGHFVHEVCPRHTGN